MLKTALVTARIQAMSNEDLVRMVSVESDQWQPEAVQIAAKELSTREVDATAILKEVDRDIHRDRAETQTAARKPENYAKRGGRRRRCSWSCDHLKRRAMPPSRPCAALAMVRATGDIPQNVNFAVNAPVARILLDAVGVQYSTASAPQSMSPADIGGMAKVFTVQLECRR